MPQVRADRTHGPGVMVKAFIYFFILFGGWVMLLLTVALGPGWGLQTRAAPQKPAAPWCWSHPWWTGRKKESEKTSYFQYLHLKAITLFSLENNEIIQEISKHLRETMRAFLHSNSCFSAFLSCFCSYTHCELSMPSGGNLNSWPVLIVSSTWGGG